MDDYPKYAIVRGTVSGRQQYGALITLESGDRGFVDASYLVDTAEGALPGPEWPEMGRTVEAVVLGTTRDGRVRLTTRDSDLALARSASNLAGAFEVWEQCRDADETQSPTVASFLALPDANAVLSWALHLRPPSSDLERALRILAANPTETI